MTQCLMTNLVNVNTLWEEEHERIKETACGGEQ